MKQQCSPVGRLAALCRSLRAVSVVVYSGLWVLGFEIAWLLGPDFAFRGRIRAMRRQRDALHGELARLVTLADPKREQVSGDLALLESDLGRVERARETRRAVSLSALHRHLPAGFFMDAADPESPRGFPEA